MTTWRRGLQSIPKLVLEEEQLEQQCHVALLSNRLLLYLTNMVSQKHLISQGSTCNLLPPSAVDLPPACGHLISVLHHITLRRFPFLRREMNENKPTWAFCFIWTAVAMNSVFVTYTGAIAIVAEETGAYFSIKLLKKILLKEKRNLSLGDKESPFLCLSGYSQSWLPLLQQKLTVKLIIQGKEAEGKFLKIPNRHSTELLILLAFLWINYHLIEAMFCLNCTVFPAVLKITYFHIHWRVSEALPLCSSPWWVSLSDTHKSWWSNLPLSSDFVCVPLKFFSLRSHSLHTTFLRTDFIPPCYFLKLLFLLLPPPPSLWVWSEFLSFILGRKY